VKTNPSFVLLLIALPLCAQQFTIDSRSISGGGGLSTNGQYSLSGTIGQPDAGVAMNGGNYSVTGGFWSLISVIQTTGAPALTVAHSGNSVTISWPSPSTGFVLQQNSDLATTNWIPANSIIADDGTTKSITITSATGNLFFRLKSP
jgi:hypothetical protein